MASICFVVYIVKKKPHWVTILVSQKFVKKKKGVVANKKFSFADHYCVLKIRSNRQGHVWKFMKYIKKAWW